MSDSKYLSAGICIYHGFYAVHKLSFSETAGLYWLGGRDLNPCYDGIKTRCLNRLATPQYMFELPPEVYYTYELIHHILLR